MKRRLLVGFMARSLNVVLVGPGSFKVQPPTAIQICIELDLMATSASYMATSSGC